MLSLAQYFRQDTVLTENSMQILWFGFCTGLAIAIGLLITAAAGKSPWLHNYVRGAPI